MSLAGVLPAVLVFAQEPQSIFRSGVDVIAVDVDVVDRDGGPVVGLRPDQFQVSIDGKNRKVFAAEFVSVTTGVSSAGTRTQAEPSEPAGRAPASVGPPGRVYILAFDAMSFPALEIASPREAAHAFVDRLPPNDLVGLIVFPQGPLLEPTTDHARLFQEIDRIVGQASPPELNAYAFTPSEMIDLIYLYESRGLRDPSLIAKVQEICAFTRDPDMCQIGIPPMVVRAAQTQAQFEEMEIGQRLGALQAMFKSLAGSPQRKVVVLISAGILVTDRPGGRPDLGDVGRVVGQGAAEANASIYALHFDRQRMDRMSASRSGARRSDLTRDSAILAHPLDQIAGTSGGALFTVAQGGGEFAFDRVLKETSAYYLLGVEPAGKDHDGRAHQLQVKVARKDVTVRGRSWVTLPKVNAGAAGLTSPADAASGTRASAVPRSSAPRPLPEASLEAGVRAAWFSYGRGDVDSASGLLPQAADSSPDRNVRYLYWLLKGHVLRAQEKVDESAAAYRQALEEWPEAQSARVALMTLLLARGEGEEAARLAEAIQTASADQGDPWWTYRRGDFRAYPAILAELRQAGQ